MKKIRFKYFTTISIIFIFCRFLNGQELSEINKKALLTVNGGCSINQIAYFTNDTLKGRDPFAFTFMANLNFSIYGWTIPFSVIYSNRRWSYQ